MNSGFFISDEGAVQDPNSPAAFGAGCDTFLGSGGPQAGAHQTLPLLLAAAVVMLSDGSHTYAAHGPRFSSLSMRRDSLLSTNSKC